MITKICTKCKIEKDVSCFYIRHESKDGFRNECKECKSKYNKQYRKYHTKQIAKKQKEYHDKYGKNNVKQKAVYDKQYNKSAATFKNNYKKLKIFENVRQCPENLKLLEVKCAYCGKWTIPTNMQVACRIQAFNGTITGEQRFYCSKNCKQSCPTYGQMKYPKGFKQATSREVVPLLRQLVLERDNYTCQKCGATTETAQLHVHHEKSYTLNKIMANDPDNCITLCKDCHKWVHSRKGCRTSDLKCK